MSKELLEQHYEKQIKHCDMSLDSEFESLINIGHLRWKPWIGADWKKADRSILIVGESHYAAKPDDKDILDRVVEWENDVDSTREVVCEVGVDEWYTSRFFGNLHRALLGRDIHGTSRTALWRHLAFCNFIQRPMHDSAERPSSNEFFKGWRFFMELLKCIRPETVLFVGVSAANLFDGAMSALDVEHTIAAEAKINGAYPRDFSVAFDGMNIRMLAIRHVSQYFSWEEWSNFLAKKLPKEVAYLRRIASAEKSIESVVQRTDALSAAKSTEDVMSARTHTLNGLPTRLHHKSVVACDYQEINKTLGDFDSSDPRFISVGHAQYNPNEASVKIFRWSSTRWSRQSEEVPVQRLPYMMAMLLATIYRIQHPGEAVPGDLGDIVVAPQDMESLKEQLQHYAISLKDGFSRVKKLLGDIDFEML